VTVGDVLSAIVTVIVPAVKQVERSRVYEHDAARSRSIHGESYLHQTHIYSRHIQSKTERPALISGAVSESCVQKLQRLKYNGYYVQQLM